MTDPYRPPSVYPPAPPGPRPILAEHPQANTVLVLGVVGVFVPIVSFVAWSMGNRVLREIRAAGPAGGGSEQYVVNEQYVVIGRVLGIVLSLLQIAALALGAAAIVSWLIFVGTVVATSGG
jgi:hypothetical protein